MIAKRTRSSMLRRRERAGRLGESAPDQLASGLPRAAAVASMLGIIVAVPGVAWAAAAAHRRSPPASPPAAMQLEQVGPYLWRIPRDAGRGMRVPGWSSPRAPDRPPFGSDAALEQLANGATLPGIVRAALAMPDIHQGYGLPVGGVVATDAAHGRHQPRRDRVRHQLRRAPREELG